MRNYKQMEVDFFRARATFDFATMQSIADRARAIIHMLDVRCQFYCDQYGARLDIHDHALPRTPLQDKYERLLLEYNEANRLGKVVAAYV